MADETLGLEIKYTLDASDLIVGTREVNESLEETGKVMEQTGQVFKNEADEIENSVGEMADGVEAKTKETQEELAKTGKAAKGTGAAVGDGAKDGIVGLDGLQDSAALTSSSMGQLGSAVGVFDSNLGSAVSAAGALSGGVEGATKLTKGFGTVMGGLTSPVGLVATGLLAAGVAIFAWSKKAKKAAIDNSELEDSLKALASAQLTFANTEDELAVLEGRTTALRAQFARLGETVEKEFADKLKEANDPFQEFTDQVDKAREKYEALEQKMADQGISRSGWGGLEGAPVETLHAYQNQLDRLSLSWFEAESAQADALKGMSEAAVARRKLIAGIQEEEDNRRKILKIRIKQEEDSARQSKLLKAQSENDEAAIRAVSMEMAIQGDISMAASMAMLNYGSAMARVALQAGGVMGPALHAATAAIDAQLQKTKEQMLIDSRYNTILQDNLAGMKKNTAEKGDAADAEDDLSQAMERGAEMLAQARGQLAIINKEHKATLQEIATLTEQGAVTEDQAAELISAANKKKRESETEYIASKHEAMQAEHDLARESVALAVSTRDQLRDEIDGRMDDARAAYESGFATEEEFLAKKEELQKEYNKRDAALTAASAEETLANAKMATDQLSAFMDATIAMKTQQLDQEEAAALERAAGNMKEQDKIRKKFEKKRQSELKAAFKTRQALEVANALISGASAAIAALAPPPVGAGPVVGAFMAAGIAATTAMQVATIQQQQPSFHQGGIVGGEGDQAIMAQGGEVVLNRDAVAAMGGASSAESLNRGGGMGGAVVIQMTYRNRVFDQMVVDNLAKGGPLKKALGRATKRGRRGRIGGRL